MRLLFSLLFWCCYLLVLAHLVCWPCSCYRSPTGDVPALLLFSPFSCSRESLLSSCRFSLFLASVFITILLSPGWCYFLVLALLLFLWFSMIVLALPLFLHFSCSRCSLFSSCCSCYYLVLALLFFWWFSMLVFGFSFLLFSLFSFLLFLLFSGSLFSCSRSSLVLPHHVIAFNDLLLFVLSFCSRSSPLLISTSQEYVTLGYRNPADNCFGIVRERLLSRYTMGHPGNYLLTILNIE